jgi:DNA-binding MarR family transcriptional regulator
MKKPKTTEQRMEELLAQGLVEKRINEATGESLWRLSEKGKSLSEEDLCAIEEAEELD